MFKLYQKSWHSIEFSKLKIPLSIANLPGDAFYKEFYRKFNEKYQNLNQLDKNWLSLKKKAALEIAKYLPKSKSVEILSVGAGLGIIEKKLYDLGYKNLYIQEVSETATRYSRDFIEAENIFIGTLPKCINKDKEFDYILLGGIEYLFNDQELQELLSDLKKFMHEKSKIILLSWSIEEESILFKMKSVLKQNLIKLGLYDPGQFWGYARKLKELTKILKIAGFKIKIAKIENTVNPWITGFFLIDK